MSSSLTFWKRIRRTPYQAIAATMTIFITLFVMAVFLIMAGGSSAMLTYLESKPQLTVFFKDDKDKDSINQLISNIKNTGRIASINYISKEQALAIYKEQNKNDPLLLEMVTADILPASLEVSTVSPVYLSELAENLKKEKGIDEVVFQKDVVDTLVSWTNTIRKVGLVFISFLLVATFFIILTSIGMKIALRKDEIEILQLVGATPWYIKKPFIFEGVTYGFAGSALSFVLVSVILLYFTPYASSFLQGIPNLTLFKYANIALTIWPPNAFLFLSLFIVLLFSGLIIGFIGSIFAISRYMKN